MAESSSADRQTVRALAQFVKRVQWEHFVQCAADKNEAELIKKGVIALQEALAEKGFAPR